MKYRWTASSDDGSFSDSSAKTFDTQAECYMDMMNHAIDKMKWNVEWNDVCDDCVIVPNKDGILIGSSCIEYNAQFFTDKIIHKSYSGIYTYSIMIERNAK